MCLLTSTSERSIVSSAAGKRPQNDGKTVTFAVTLPKTRCNYLKELRLAKERYYFVKNVPTKEYSILYNCPHPEVRRMWLPKAIEEEGEDLIGKSGKPHPEYWLKLCAALGLYREYVIDSEPLFGVKFA